MSSKSFWTRRSGPPKQSSRDGARPASRRSTRFPGLVLVAGVVLALTMPLIAIFDFQRVTPNPLSQNKAASQAVAIQYSYTASATLVSGFGLRVHFDSSRLNYVSVTGLLTPADDEGPDFTFGPSTPQDDTGNEDADNSTDKVVLIAWAHTGANGGGFPGPPLPKTLFTINFTTAANFTATTRVNVSSIDTAQGFDFQGQSAVINAPGANTPTPLPPTPTPTPFPGGDKAMLDVDGNGVANSSQDGLMVLKYLIGFRDNNLTNNGALISFQCMAPRCDNAGIQAYIESIRPHLDVDGNGTATSNQDGLMIIKYLIGFRDENLTNNGALISFQCTAPKCTANGIEAYIETMRVP